MQSAFPWILCFRIFDALIVQTYYNPDEYWQSVEVAHEMAFGYGHKTWEWQEGARIRGYSHPLLFAVLFKLLQVLGLDSRNIVAVAPRVLQALFAAVADIYVYKFAHRLFGPVVARYALFASLVNWFTFYCMVRTFSNSTEATLAAIVFYRWPWTIPDVGSPLFASMERSRRIAIVVASAAFLIRPSSAVLWVFLGIHHLTILIQKQQRSKLVVRFLVETVLIGGLFVFLGVLIDRIFYGVWTFVPYNFLQFNSLSGGSRLYGLNHWSYYFTEALPVMLFSLIPAFLYGIRQYWGTPAWLFLFVLVLYSFTGHKEYRFILPVYPIALVYAGRGLAMLCSNSSRKRWLLPIIAMTNAGVAAYLSVSHQRAPIAVLNWLSSQTDVNSVVVLAGCHSTPHYSLFHMPSQIPLTFLDCSPSHDPVGLDLTLDFTESKDFLRDPLRFSSSFFEIPAQTSVKCVCVPDNDVSSCLANECCARYSNSCAPVSLTPLPEHWVAWVGDNQEIQTLPNTDLAWWGANWHRKSPTKLPSHLVLFDRSRPALLPFLKHCGFSFIERFDHALISDEGRYLEIWARPQTS